MTRLWPGTGEIQIRQFSLAIGDAELRGVEQLLSTDERQRADRLLDRQIRNRFIAGRGRLRQILAGYFETEPADLLLTTNPFGKPGLKYRHNHGLCFNLSHSGDSCILALARDCELGVDLEQVRDDLPFEAIARQYFSRHEQSELFSLMPAMQPAAFYRCWTRKEAYLKACGSGFSSPSDICDVSLLPDQPPELLALRNAPEQLCEWNLADLAVPEGFCAALAARTQISAVIYLR